MHSGPPRCISNRRTLCCPLEPGVQPETGCLTTAARGPLVCRQLPSREREGSQVLEISISIPTPAPEGPWEPDANIVAAYDILGPLTARDDVPRDVKDSIIEAMEAIERYAL